MKHYHVRLARRPKQKRSYRPTIKKVLLMPVNALPLLLGMLFPTSLLIALIVFGLPGVLVHESPWGCTYQDMIGTYARMPYRSKHRCNRVAFRPVLLIGSQ